MTQLSIWEKEGFFSDQDIIIAGSGFSGLWSALHLKLLNPRYKITILERGLIPTGASTRNAGFSCFGSPSELIYDAGIMGEEEMWNLVAMRYKGLQKIRECFNDLEIDYDSSGGYECFTNDSEDWKECITKINWLNDGLKKITGEEKVFTITDEKLAGFGFHGFEHMIENRLEGGLHPAKLVKALLKKVQALDVQVLTGIEVTNYTESGDRVYLDTSEGIGLTAKKLLLCTNAFTARLFPSVDIVPNRGQVLVTAPLPDISFKGTFHFDKGFYYFRNLGNRILLGGGRNKAFNEENTTEMTTTDTIQNHLENFIRDHLLPATDFTISDRWTGIMAMGSQKAPIVQAIGTNVFCCVRMSGMGVALAPVIALQAARLIHE